MALFGALLGACADDLLPASEPAPFRWETAYSEYEGALLAGASSADTLLVVGGGAGAQEPSVVLQHDGQSWARVSVATGATLWWAWAFPESEIWAVGEEATVLRFGDTSYDQIDLGPSDASYYGVWGSSAEDVWIVGGTTAQQALLYYGDGETFAEILPEGDSRSIGTFFKVWGSSSHDVFVVGGDLQKDSGLLLHFDGARWERQVLTVPFLFTVWGTGPNDVWVVGGLGVGKAIHWDGKTWTDESPPKAPGLRGVVGDEKSVYVVGENAYSARFIRGGDVWDVAEPPVDTSQVLHAAFVTHDRVFAVGGTLLSTQLPWQGSMLYMGEPIDSGELGSRKLVPPADGGLPDDAQLPSPDAAEGTLGPGDSCPDLKGCEPGLYCWYFPVSHEYRCSRSCESGCSGFGGGSCCFVPGPQSSGGICGPADAAECGGS